MTAIESWTDFFVTEAGAAAALSGLLFVGISINLSRIISSPHLPALAVDALVKLVSILFVATFGLVPHQSMATYGYEFAATGLVVIAVQVATLVSSHKHLAQHLGIVPHLLINVAPPLPFVIAGALLVLGNADGLYWNVAGVLLSFLSGIVGAWVLLVEVQR